MKRIESRLPNLL